MLSLILIAGEGQLEISINDGDVPNAVQVLGGGKCLVTYTPDQALTHEIEVTFNGEQVPGSPFLCRVMDPKNSKSLSKSVDPDSLVSVELEHLSLIPTGEPSQFTIRVAGGDDAELAVSVQGKSKPMYSLITDRIQLLMQYCKALKSNGAERVVVVFTILLFLLCFQKKLRWQKV